MTDRVVLAVDGNSLVHRSFHAQASTGLRDSSGRPMWAVRGLLMQILAAVERIDPDAVIVGFDDPESSSRRELWPGYKAHRADKLPTLVDQLSLACSMLTALGVAVISPSGLEADDVVASVSAHGAQHGDHTVVVTSDRDAFALIASHTRVLRIINGGVEASPLLTAERLVSMLGVRPEQYCEFAALRGDPSDNLPGVSGIGAKTAARVLNCFGTVDAAFGDLDSGGVRLRAELGERCAQLLSAPGARESWRRNITMMALRGDVPEVRSLPASAGSLPLAGQQVRAACTSLQLLPSLSRALRVLSHDTTPNPAAVEARREPQWHAAPYPVRRPLPKLPRRQQQADQLALF
jgi:5'-3' exonuclease